MTIQKKYLGFGALVMLGLVLAFAPVDQAANNVTPAETLMTEFQKTNVYVSADELGHWIIDKQPGFLVVDIRSADDYGNYSIPGSVNIPLTDLTKPDNLDLLKDFDMAVLASNGNTASSQAWLMLRQKDLDNIFVLKGGLNHWVNVFANPQAPDLVYTDDEAFNYQFRKSAGPSLMGTKMVSETEADAQAEKKPIRRIRKKKSAKIDEGC